MKENEDKTSGLKNFEGNEEGTKAELKGLAVFLKKTCRKVYKYLFTDELLYARELKKIQAELDNPNLEKKVLGNILGRASSIAEKSKELAPEALNTFVKIVNHPHSDSDINRYTYEILGNKAKNPEDEKLSLKALEIFSEIVKNPQNDDKSLANAYITLSNIALANKDLVPQVLDITAGALKNPQNDNNSLTNAYFTLGKIAVANKDLAPQTLDVFAEALKNPKNIDEYQILEMGGDVYNVLGNAYKTLGDIALAHKDLAPQVLGVTAEAVKNPDYRYLDGVYGALGNIALANKDLAPQVLDVTAEALKNHDYRYFHNACDTLSNIALANKDLAPQVLDITAEALKNPQNDDETLERLYAVLGKIAIANKDMAPQVLNQALLINDKDASLDNDKNLLEIMALTYRKVNQSKLPDLTEHQQHLFEVAQSMQYSKREEIQYALESYSQDDIKNINFSNISKNTALILKEVAREEIKNGTSTDMKASLKAAYENQADWMIPASFKAAEIFGSDVKSYLKKTEGFLNIHDSVYWLPKKMSEDKNQSFNKFIRKQITYYTDDGVKNCRPLNELSIIAKNWHQLTPEQEQGSYQEILSVCRSKKYADQKYDSFAIEAARCGVSEESYPECESMYNSGLRVPTPFDCSKEYKFGNYTGRFLPRDDVRVGFFGEHTNCCQHFGGVGNSCAVSTIKDPYSQLFVIENNKGDIVAGSWTWENTEGKYRDVCFDNIEALKEYENKPMINKIYEHAARDLVNTYGCHKVTIGKGYQDANISKYKETESIPLPSHYDNSYSDAKNQVLLIENKEASEIDHSQETPRFIREVDPSDLAALKRISRACFPEGNQEIEVSGTLKGMAIVDQHKGIVGYCLYDEENRDITDMAVLPEYRKDKNASSRKLMAEVIKKVREIGGEWHADARNTTSLRYLKAMSGRGLINLEDNGVEYAMGDGTKVHDVKFSIIEPKKSAQKENMSLLIANRQQSQGR